MEWQVILSSSLGRLRTRIANSLDRSRTETVTASVHGWPVYFQPEHRHEALYAEHFRTGARNPQIEIDLKIFRKFIPAQSRVLDAGANIGITALQMIAAGARHVVALEPAPEIAQRARRLFHPRVDVIEAALSHSVGSVEFMLSTAHNQGSTYKSQILDRFPSVFSGSQTISVATTTIDALTEKFGPFSFWKLDIEGAEIDAIRGGATALQSAPPVAIWAEIFGQDDVWRFKEMLQRTHSRMHRVFIDKISHELVMKPLDYENNPDLYCHNSPMYIAFCN